MALTEHEVGATGRFDKGPVFLAQLPGEAAGFRYIFTGSLDNTGPEGLIEVSYLDVDHEGYPVAGRNNLSLEATPVYERVKNGSARRIGGLIISGFVDEGALKHLKEELLAPAVPRQQNGVDSEGSVAEIHGEYLERMIASGTTEPQQPDTTEPQQ